VKSAYSLPVLLFFSIALPHMIVAQSTGSILGTVTDASGGAIASAAVTVTETGTNTQRVLTTDSAGRYVANVLQLGTYSVKVTAQGFRGAEKTGIVLEAQASPQIDFSLAPATVSSEVTVEATPVEIQTTNAALNQVVHSEQVADLPLNGRNFVELATLAPGVSQGDQPGDFFGGGSSSETSIRGTFSLSVGGSRENRTDWLYDGVDNEELTAYGTAESYLFVRRQGNRYKESGEFPQSVAWAAKPRRPAIF